MESSARFRINSPKVINETIDGEAVIVNLDTGCYYSLDQVGAHIWDSLGKNASAEEITDDLVHRYDCSRADIENAVSRLIMELQDEDLVLLDPTGKTEAPKGSEMPVGAMPRIEKIHFEPPTLQKYTDMQDLLLLDPIHEVDETGWPSTKLNTPGENE